MTRMTMRSSALNLTFSLKHQGESRLRPAQYGCKSDVMTRLFQTADQR